jgi:hypothetical protein
MQILYIQDLSNSLAINILEKGLQSITDPKLVKNYHPDYKEDPANLFYILKNGRYSQNHGKYFIITDDNSNYIASAGWNEYDLNTNVALLLTRMYIVPEYRTQYIIGKNILSQMIIETNNYQKRWITVNNYNRLIYTYFERASQAKSTTLFNDWPEIYRRFKPIGNHLVYYTEQWVAEYE